MIIKADHNSCFVFDLDDTLYSEIDYLKSGYNFIANEISPDQSENLYQQMMNIYMESGNAFKYLLEKFPEKNLTIEKLLYLYRNHNPLISLRIGVLNMLNEIKERNATIGVITDGRGLTQRNKIQALGIMDYIDKLIISEEIGKSKPSPELFNLFIEKENTQKQFYYFADNPAKDFIIPKKLSWCCIGVTVEDNIHSKKLFEFSHEFLPHIFIRDFTEIEII